MEDGTSVWAAISEDGIGILDLQTLQQIGRYSFGSIQTFGGAVDEHFMFVVDDTGKKRRILFGGMSKLKVSIFFVINIYLLLPVYSVPNF